MTMEATSSAIPQPDSEATTLPHTQAHEKQWTPESVLSTIPYRYATESSSPIPFFHLLERLKTTKREGWRRFGIDHGESISDHMYRMSILTMLAPQSLSSNINVPHCTKMALVHDMAEALVGDITPVDGIPKQEKSRRESEAMDYICAELLGRVHGGFPGQDIRRVWQEYEDGETLDSKFVHDIDKVELLLQVVEYERAGEREVDLGQFTQVRSQIKLPEVQLWADQVLMKRHEFWTSRGKTPEWQWDLVNKCVMGGQNKDAK